MNNAGHSYSTIYEDSAHWNQRTSTYHIYRLSKQNLQMNDT
jgi:hypothetical protein